MAMKYKTGYTQGVFDMFHIGHLNLLNGAKEYCEYLVVGVNADSLIEEYKHKTPVINEEERAEIIRNIKAVDKTIIAKTLDKVEMLKIVKFDVIFIGDDWKGNPRWEKTRIDLGIYGIDVIYLPYTANISSSTLRFVKDYKVEEQTNK